MPAATIVASIVTGGSNNHATVSSEANAYATDFVSKGVLGAITNSGGVAPAAGSFGVNQNTGSDMALKIVGTGNTTNGQSVAYIQVAPSSQDIQVLRARMSSDYTGYTINSNSSGVTQYDWIYLKADPTNANTPSSAADNVATLFTSRSTSNSSDNGAPPTYGVLLAVVTVANGATAITNANIADKRTQVIFNTGATTSATGWTALSQAFTYGANNGSKEFTVTTPNDMTGILSPGMRMSFTRSITPPTQSALFTAASSQYATKASPSGITFTAAFACESWIKLNSYTGQQQWIVGRSDNATSGFGFFVSANGQLVCFYASSSNFTSFTSYRSIPLNERTHVAVAVSSVSSKTAVFYINGTLVASFTSTSNSTALTQDAVDLRVGASATPTNTYLDGELSEVRVWSANITQSQVQQNMAINLTGSETNLVGLWQFNGNGTDATSNANTLTATNGASFTTTGNPYRAIEYARILAVSFSNPTSTITLDTGIHGTIPNQTLNSPQYSTADCPFGFPLSLRKYKRYVESRAAFSSTTAGSFFNISPLAITLTAPTAFTFKMVAGGSSMKSSQIAGDSTYIGIFESATELAQAKFDEPVSTYNSYAFIQMPAYTPTSGSHTYQVQGKQDAAGTFALDAGIGLPMYFEIEEV